MGTLELRPRSVTEIVDAAFELLRREYVTLVTIAAVIQGALVVLQIAMGPDVLNPLKFAEHLGSFALLMVAGLVALALSDAAIIVAVNESYFGRRASVARALARMGARSIPLILASIIRGVAAYFALIVFIVPGVYVYSRLAALPAVIVLEDGGTFGSIERSWKLAQDLVWPTFLTMTLAWIVYFALSAVFTLGITLLGAAVPLFAQPNVSLAVGRLAAVFVYPFVGVVTMLLYYDFRVRKEALDLELMAQELEAPAPA